MMEGMFKGIAAAVIVICFAIAFVDMMRILAAVFLN